MDDVLLQDMRGAVCVLALNRPTRLNALNPDLVRALSDALRAAQEDAAISVVVLRGEGRAFCAGADTASAPQPMTAEFRKNMIYRNVALLKLLSWLDKPIIAAVQGYAVGLGANLAFGSDFVVAAESAKFVYPELKAGLTTPVIAAHSVHHIGKKMTFEMMALCDPLPPQRAIERGLINRVVPDDSLFQEAMTVAERMAGWNPELLMQTKRTVNRAAEMDPDQALDMGRDMTVLTKGFPKPT
jgi:enoyl-CoA hydratase/carnithine racemase